MNLSVYLLLAAENEIGHNAPAVPVSSSPLPVLVGQQARPVYKPCSPAAKVLLQASHRRHSAKPGKPAIARTLEFSLAVFANAVGFLMMTSGLLLLLQIAQASLA